MFWRVSCFSFPPKSLLVLIEVDSIARVGVSFEKVYFANLVGMWTLVPQDEQSSVPGLGKETPGNLSCSPRSVPSGLPPSPECFFDLAVRDVEMALAAFVLARTTEVRSGALESDVPDESSANTAVAA